MTRDAQLVGARRGAYAAASDLPLDPRVAHLRLLEATVAQSSGDLVVSHASAAVLHGLPIGHDQLDRVHLTQDRNGEGRIGRYVHLHGAALAADEVTPVDGYRVTDLSRTVLDLGCALTPLIAVPIGDAALRGPAALVDRLNRAFVRGRAAERLRARCSTSQGMQWAQSPASGAETDQAEAPV